jgi:mannitol/fructose-specific phosphotransferase system IIA component (Ntr-type)
MRRSAYPALISATIALPEKGAFMEKRVRPNVGELIRRFPIIELKSAEVRGALQEMLDALAGWGLLEPAWVPLALKGLMLRESCPGTTAIRGGFALPHLRYYGQGSKLPPISNYLQERTPTAHIPNCNDLLVVLGRSHQGIHWEALDGEPVHLAVLILAPEERPGDLLCLVEGLNRAIRRYDGRADTLLSGGISEVAAILFPHGDEQSNVAK